MQTRTNLQHREVLDAHNSKQLGKVIRLLTAQPPQSCNLHTLHCPTEGQITDHFRIHIKVTEFFSNWYQAPPDMDPSTEALTTTPDWWKQLLSIPSGSQYKGLHPNSAIPPDLQIGLRKVCATKASPAIQAEIQASIDKLITYDEFSAAIDNLRAGSAPGPSETTPSMLLAWSPAIRLFIYQHMLKVWQHRSCPTWLKDKVIKLAPKVADSNDLTHMRPISLYEVIRKVWTTTVAKRIHLIWHHHQLLNPAQYGYRHDNGILMPLYNLINTIENAHLNSTPTLVTFWDMKRAFDSIPRNLQRLAWTRLGVPTDVAEWFVSLDDGGLAYIDTPHFQMNKNLHSSQSILTGVQHFPNPSSSPEQPQHLGFNPQRGIGQGESASSLMWVAVYDILLDWIDPNNKQLHPFNFSDLSRPTHIATPESTTSRPSKTQAVSNAYADDLATISTGNRAHQIQQLQAEWISAFCAFTGLQLNMQKIVPVAIGKHAANMPNHITVYNHHWQPTKCPIQTTPTNLSYLGLLLDHIIANDNQKAVTALRTHITTLLEHLLDQPGPVTAKIDYIRFKILPIVLHTAQCANWSLLQYRNLDIQFNRAYKTILILPTHFPTALLYLPSAKGGVGLPRFSDRAQVMKWRAFHRSLAVGHQPAQAINAILHRLPTQMHPSLPLVHHVLPPKWTSHQKLTARSLAEWLSESGLTAAYTTAFTEDQLQARARNVISLDQVAKTIHLRFDPDIHDPDLPVLPLKFYVTDGSFKVETTHLADILTSEHELRQHGTGAAGIVFTPATIERTPYPHTVRIITRSPQTGLSAYAWELLAQVVALKLTQYHPNTLPGYSDCTAAIARMNTALSTFINPLGFTTAGILATSAHDHSSLTRPRRITHVKAHPERDPTRTTHPTPLDSAIFLADAIAGDTTTKFGRYHINHIPHTLVLEDVMSELLPLQAWHLRHTNNMDIPVLDLPWIYQHEHQLRTYLLRRDQ